MLFFIIYSSVRTKKDAEKLLWIMMLALLGVIFYGLGQKYFYWPVYSTMNREFSKGIRLYLTEHARVQSTFAGHYDLAAYLVILLPLNLALIFNQLKNWQRWLLIIVQTLGVWILIMTASRTSFVAYLLASLIVIALFALQKESVKTKFTWFISRITAWSLMILILIWVFGGSLKTRLAQTLEAYPALYEGYQLIDQSFNKSSSQLAIFLNFDQLKFLPTSVQDSTEELDAEESQTADNLSDQDAAVLVPSDERPTRQRPGDVYEDIPDKIQIATQSATGETEYITIEQPRVWSENALEHGLSLAIRLDSLWPRAIRGFLRQPFLGSGYATLNKTSLTDFTIADSTDNNFLRILGETGLLGFLTFFGVILTTLIKALLNLRTNEKLLTSLSIAYIGATMGLLLNAFYIDVFAASKVAFTFWAVTGLLLAYDQLYSLTPTKKTPTKKTKKTRKVKKIQKKEKSL